MSVTIKRSLHIIIFISIIAFAIWVGVTVKENYIVKDIVMQYGYIGIFFASIISGFNILTPIPVVAFFPLFIALGLNQWVTLAFIIIGVTTADMFAYYLGRVGKHLSPTRVQRKANKLNRFLKNYHKTSIAGLVFFSGFVPFPNEFLVVPMAFLGYRFSTILLAVLFGNTVFNIFAMFGIINLVAYI